MSTSTNKHNHKHKFHTHTHTHTHTHSQTHSLIHTHSLPLSLSPSLPLSINTFYPGSRSRGSFSTCTASTTLLPLDPARVSPPPLAPPPPPPPPVPPPRRASPLEEDVREGKPEDGVLAEDGALDEDAAPPLDACGFYPIGSSCRIVCRAYRSVSVAIRWVLSGCLWDEIVMVVA